MKNNVGVIEMILFTAADKKKLLKQGAAIQSSNINKPVVKLFTPWGRSTWLISEIDPQDETMLYGLCDHGMGAPELGWVSLREIQSVKGPFGLKIERDRSFTPNKTLAEYADIARWAGQIVA